MQPWLRRPGVAWCLLAALMLLGALVAMPFERTAIDWQPASAITQPWRWWTALFVHYSAAHLLANLGAVLLVAIYGWSAQVPLRSAVAWAAAWPLTHLALVIQPELHHYGGLSGVMHTGVAIACIHLMAAGTRAQKFVGASVLTGMLAKVVSESPWTGPLQYEASWDIAVAPIAHATGSVAGILCSAAVEAWAWQRRRAQARMRLTSAVVE
jgi:rhomboid family GlyGly-CTERM serine protease